MRAGRFDGVWLGALAGLFLGELETLCRYLPAVSKTELLAVPAPALEATGVYIVLGALGGLLHRWGGVALLAALALATIDEDAVGALAVPAAAALGWLAARRPAFAVGGVALAIVGAFALPREAPPAPGEPTRPDLVFVVLDTVAAAHTSLHGAELDTTPALVALAEEGIDWRQAIAPAPWTVPSHASMFTGAPPRSAGAHHEHLALPEELPTLAEQLAAHGYRTGAFVANGWLGRYTGITRGFAYQEGRWELRLTRNVFAWQRFRRRFVTPPRDKNGAELVARALAWLDRGGDRPSFAFVNLLEAHSPYQQVPEPRRFGPVDAKSIGQRVERVQVSGAEIGFPRDGEIEQVRLLYAAAIRGADDLLGELVAGLRGRGRFERTVLLVTADHGEAFGEHGFVGHAIGLHPPVLHVPLVVRGPGLPRGVRVEPPVSLARVHPTLLAIGSGEAQPGSLLPLHESPSNANEGAPVISEHRRPGWLLMRFQNHRERDLSSLDIRALRVQRGAHVLLREQPAGGGSPRYAFYDLASDPGEQRPLWPDPRADALLQQLVAHDRLPVEGEGTPYFSDDVRERLEALGYLSADD